VDGLRDGENPARWRDNLKDAYGKQKASKKHHAAIAFADMPAFMLDLRKLESTSARALVFTILTAARTGEVRGARWSEVDLDKAIWVIPAERMKVPNEHRVPLSDRALAILRVLKRGKPGDLIFPGAKPGEPLSDAALLMCLRGLRDGVTTHGFRSSFKDWATEGKPGFPNWLSELALAHTIKDKTEAAYRRGDALEMRAPMMAAWDSYLWH
jgi:integrase